MRRSRIPKTRVRKPKSIPALRAVVEMFVADLLAHELTCIYPNTQYVNAQWITDHVPRRLI